MKNDYLQLSENYRIRFDPKNIILQVKYEKKEGRGAGAKGTGQYDYKDYGYYGNLQSFSKRLLEKEFIEQLSNSELEEINSLVEIINNTYDKLISLKDEIFLHINEHITINLGEPTRGKKRMVKGMEISEDE